MCAKGSELNRIASVVLSFDLIPVGTPFF
jgi:hypothetical protein